MSRSMPISVIWLLVAIVENRGVGDCNIPKNCGSVGNFVTHLGGIESEKNVYVGAKAEIDRYDPQLCGKIANVAATMWWVMLYRRTPAGQQYVQCGWFKGYASAFNLRNRNSPAFAGDLYLFTEERNASGVIPPWRRQQWDAPNNKTQSLLCECLRVDLDPKLEQADRSYILKLGDSIAGFSRSFKCTFAQAQFMGETHHDHNQMPGGKAGHVFFKNCQTRLISKKTVQQYGNASLYQDQDCPANGPFQGSVKNNQVEIWDERCP